VAELNVPGDIADLHVGCTKPAKGKGDLSPHVLPRRQRADQRLLQDSKALCPVRRGGESVAKLDRAAPPESLELNVRIGELAGVNDQK
jgi:hypothetical protein